MTLPGWEPPAKDMTNMVLACVVAFVIVSVIAVFRLDQDLIAIPFLFVVFLTAILMVMILVAKVVKNPNSRHTRKRFLKWREEGVEAIADALEANGVKCQRQGPEGQGPTRVMETFVVGSEQMTIVVKDLLGAGLFVMVGPVDEFNQVSLESLQRIVDGALAPPHHHERIE